MITIPSGRKGENKFPSPEGNNPVPGAFQEPGLRGVPGTPTHLRPDILTRMSGREKKVDLSDGKVTLMYQVLSELDFVCRGPSFRKGPDFLKVREGDKLPPLAPSGNQLHAAKFIRKIPNSLVDLNIFINACYLSSSAFLV